MKRCTRCNAEIEKYCEFPNQTCQKCYSAMLDKIPLHKLEKPDFSKSLNI